MIMHRRRVIVGVAGAWLVVGLFSFSQMYLLHLGLFNLDYSLASTYVCANKQPIRGRTVGRNLLIRYLMMGFLCFYEERTKMK